MFKLTGVHLKHKKNTADIAAERIPAPKFITVPMLMHIGAPAKPVVSIGQRVCVGELIGEATGPVSSPVYSGISGTVKKIEDSVASNGSKVQSIVIESDGLMELAENIVPPVINSKEDFLSAVKNSGIVGLGGAGFPVSAKLNTDISKIDTLIINAAECEPYITSDTRTMLDEADILVEGIKLIMDYLEVTSCVIGIENNKPQCIKSVKAAIGANEGIVVKSLPAVYPQGGEKVIVYHTVGRVIKEGMLPKDVGVVVMNCTTTAAIAKYVKTGMPLVEKGVTVDGSAVKNPKNVIAPIGTPISELFEYCGGFSEEPRKVLYGGPMMGIAVYDTSLPVLKQTNAVLAFGQKEATPPRETACIKCGRCVENCPFGLVPVEISRAYKLGDMDSLERLKVNLCMECGCCSYVCPAKKNIVQLNRLAKASLKEYQLSKKREDK